jgi:hypothetical protein
MPLSEHNRQILARLANTKPVQPTIERILVQGKKTQLLGGVDAKGKPFAKLAKSTLKRRKGWGPPLSPRRAESRLPSRYAVFFQDSPNGVRVSAGWLGLPWLKYHKTGTERMPKRDPGGFRAQDSVAAGKALRAWIMEGKV